MPYVVDADLGYVRLVQQLSERPASEIVRIHRDSPGTGKHQVDFTCVAFDRRESALELLEQLQPVSEQRLPELNFFPGSERIGPCRARRSPLH